MLDKETRLGQNYDEIHYNFVSRLIEEGGYSKQVAENTNDGRDEYVEKEYQIYLSNK